MAKEYKLVELTDEEYEKLKYIRGNGGKACQKCIANDDDLLCEKLDPACLNTKYSYYIEVTE